MKKRLGFIGLGIMGRAMAANLLRAGFPLTVWNRTPNKGEPLLKGGAQWADSPAEVVEKSDITFVMVSDPPASREVLFSQDGGALSALREGKGYVEMSTIDPDTSTRLAEAVREQKALYLEAPVSGSKKPAEDGTLIIMAAGSKELYEMASPAFQVMGKKHYFLGEVGRGAQMKLVVNMIMGAMMTAFSEGVALAERAELPLDTLLEILDGGAMSNPMFRVKGPNLLKRNFPTAFPLKHIQKDLRLALALGESLQQPLPTAASANELFKMAKNLGLSDADFSAVAEVLLPPSKKE